MTQFAVNSFLKSKYCARCFLVVAAASFVVVGCANRSLAARQHCEHFSPALSQTDINQIKSLVAARRDIKQPVFEIATEKGQRNRARVSSGHWIKPGDQADYFDVEKRNGLWRIISPIWHDRLKAEDILIGS